MRKILILTTLIGCATTPQEQLKSEVMQDNVSMNAVLNLGRTSFIKGCLFGIQAHYFEKTGGKKLEYCKQASRGHEEELKQLLK